MRMEEQMCLGGLACDIGRGMRGIQKWFKSLTSSRKDTSHIYKGVSIHLAMNVS